MRQPRKCGRHLVDMKNNQCLHSTHCVPRAALSSLCVNLLSAHDNAMRYVL